ncbi:hypothetical protein GQR58_000096 [Nymphon striatum]|nr:hypothetical protein GQR58_000096 [Nymphon striatum]
MQGGPDLSALPDMVEVNTVGETALFVQVDEVTVAQWNRCFDAGACELKMSPPKGGAAEGYPATGVSYPDAQQYIAWLNKVTDHHFRLPTSQEWLALAHEVMPEKPDPIFTDPELTWASAYLTEGRISRKLLPTGIKCNHVARRARLGWQCLGMDPGLLRGIRHCAQTRHVGALPCLYRRRCTRGGYVFPCARSGARWVCRGHPACTSGHAAGV